MVKTDQEHELPATIDKQLTECVNYAYEQLAPQYRYLTTATRILPMDFPRWDRLYKWLRSDGIRSDGEYAYLFDNPRDELVLSAAKMGFDMTYLMSQPPQVLTAVCMYLMARIKLSLDKQRVSIFFDEG